MSNLMDLGPISNFMDLGPSEAESTSSMYDSKGAIALNSIFVKLK